MKRFCILLLVIAMLLGVVSCGGTTPAETTGQDETGAPVTSSEEITTAEATTAEETTAAEEAGIPKRSVPEKIKILALGSSFSVDCMEYLYALLKNAGVKEVTLGNLYYGGCAVYQHLEFALADSASYTYYKTTTGSWTTTKPYKMSDALADEDWDIITMQESSRVCGLSSYFDASFSKLVDYVRSKNTTAELVWNMTWAYQQDATHSSFPNYDNDQMKMYTMLVDCVKNYPCKDERISFIIPVGTAIQNARTSFLGDTLTRDGYHLDKNIGRYIAAMTWCCAITGVEPTSLTYNPSNVITTDMVSVARESVANALKTPYSVTESQIKTGNGSTSGTEEIDPNEVLHAEDYIEADKLLASQNGVDLTKYTLFTWDYSTNGYWNCTYNTKITHPASTNSLYNQNICSAETYSLDTLPVGTVFICDAGWQYRIELFNGKDEKFTGTRKSLTTIGFFVLSEEFLCGATYMGWNISSSPKVDISARFAQAAVHLRVYVPNK